MSLRLDIGILSMPITREVGSWSRPHFLGLLRRLLPMLHHKNQCEWPIEWMQVSKDHLQSWKESLHMVCRWLVHMLFSFVSLEPKKILNYNAQTCIWILSKKLIDYGFGMLASIRRWLHLISPSSLSTSANCNSIWGAILVREFMCLLTSTPLNESFFVTKGKTFGLVAFYNLSSLGLWGTFVVEGWKTIK